MAISPLAVFFGLGFPLLGDVPQGCCCSVGTGFLVHGPLRLTFALFALRTPATAEGDRNFAIAVAAAGLGDVTGVGAGARNGLGDVGAEGAATGSTGVGCCVAGRSCFPSAR